MKNYEMPKLEIFALKTEDVICTSNGGLINGGEGNSGDVSGDDIFD